MDESGILPKARYGMTVFHLPGVAGQSPGGGPGGEAPGSSSDPAVHSTKKMPPIQIRIWW